MGNLTYGEVTSVGRSQLANYIKPLINKNSIFLDVGSGYGKIPTYMAENLDLYSCGIEIDKEKSKIARKILWTNKKDKIILINGDILENKTLLNQATIIYMNNVCWDDELTNFVLDNSKAYVFLMRKTHKYKKYEELSIQTSWKKEGKSPLYKLNTNTNR